MLVIFYDMLMLELRNLENKYPEFISSESLTQHVGGTVKDGFEKAPRTIISTSSVNFCGIVFTVFKLSVISSPTNPFPLVAPLTKIPFLYSKLTDKPSILVSTTKDL